ncbi:MAG: hypothetical protein C5B56_14830 [Proteobacteria bacterium]|jgi:protease YdgD|nr:MAG: hypothetical protein C5B56_14830 [Pseudomonadota bacterium]
MQATTEHGRSRAWPRAGSNTPARANPSAQPRLSRRALAGCLTAATALLALLATPLTSGARGQALPHRNPGAALAQVQSVAVFGSDERVALPNRYRSLEEKIGLLFNQRSRLVCTAFCVAPNVVATAGHCLFRTQGEHPPQLAEFFFARNYDRQRHFERIAGAASGGAAQHVLAGTTALRVRPPIDASKDWALVRLSHPACNQGVLAVATLSGEAIIAEAKAKRIFQVSYHRDFTPWKLAYSQPCGVERDFAAAAWTTIREDFADAAQLVLHTCDTGGASSGSPLLLETAEGFAVVAINVGTYVQSKVLMENGEVSTRLKAEIVANTAVNSSAFADKLASFRQAAILASAQQIRALQAALHQQHLYDGSIDGRYGANLRAAIEAYEQAQGLPATGLATEALLKRLQAPERLPRSR